MENAGHRYEDGGANNSNATSGKQNLISEYFDERAKDLLARKTFLC